MADFEDATAPTWANIIDGQLNLYDAIRGNLDFTAEDGKEYRVGDETPTIVVRPARLAAVREAHQHRRAAAAGLAGRLRAVLLPQRAGS